MLELYQFEVSTYCEKVRFCLDYKDLTYRKIEVTPGLGQIEVYRMSGQRQVPVLKDGTEVIADSTAIALWLDEKFSEKPLLPLNPQQRAEVQILESWADGVLGPLGRIVLVGAINQDPGFRSALLPDSVPPLLRNVVGAVPGELLSILGTGVGFGPEAVQSAHQELERCLQSLCQRLASGPYLVGDRPTLADFAVAALTMSIKFPDTPALNLPVSLRGRGVPALADAPAYAPFWAWRDQLYLDYRRTDLGQSSPSRNGGSSKAPTKIQID
jgi:glutathione S-transferase